MPGLLSESSRDMMRRDMEGIRSDNEFQVTLQRGNLEPYKFIGPYPGRMNIIGNVGRVFDSRSSQEVQSPTLLMLPVGADVQQGDEFVDPRGQAFKISLVRPTGFHATICEVVGKQ